MYYSASTNRSNGGVQSDVVAFLLVDRKCYVDYLALSTLGVGDFGSIRQATFSANLPLVVKRFHHCGDSRLQRFRQRLFTVDGVSI